MVDYPVDCPDCGNTYETRDELVKEDINDVASTFHCPDCSLMLYKLWLKKGRILDTEEYY